MELNSKTGFIILLGTGIVVIPLTVIYNQELTEIHRIEIEEDTVFDPLCLRTSELSLEEYCMPQGDEWYMDLGASANIEYSYDVLAPKLLFLKIDLSEIPKSNLVRQTTIVKSDLEIGFLYDAIKYLEEPNEIFFVTYGICLNGLWSENSKPLDLPCINQYGMAQMEIDSFHGIVKPDRVTKVNLDIQDHIEIAQKNNVNSFTEIVSFSAGSFVDNREVQNQVRNCLKSSTAKSEKDQCLEQNRLKVYSSEFSRTAFKPFAFVEYSAEPSILTKSIGTVVFAVYPLIGSFLTYVWRQEKSFNNKMYKVCESLEKEIQDTQTSLKSGIDDVKPTKTFKVLYDKNHEPIVFNLSDEISEVYLFTDAYSSIINSGSFENFTKEHQIEISTLYGLISEYNKTLELIYQTIESTRLSTEPIKSIDRLYWGLKTNLSIYLKHLIVLRKDIIEKIESENGLLKILIQEKNRFR